MPFGKQIYLALAGLDKTNWPTYDRKEETVDEA
jgi:hypothetical protein